MKASSTDRRDRRSVLLRMAKDQARAERIKALKDEHPEVTWEEIASYVGVSPRAANAWGANGGISAANARKLAEFFAVPFGELYHGPQPAQVDLMGVFSPDANATMLQLARIERRLDEILSRLDGPGAEIERQQAEAIRQAARPDTGTVASRGTAGPRGKAR